MIEGVQAFIERSHDAGSLSSLKEMFLGAVEAEGYENAVFARVQNRRLVSVPWSEFPKGYLSTYKAEEWDRIDPVVQRIHSAQRPFGWNQMYSRRGFTREQSTFFEQCRELGVHSGITVPIRGGAGEMDLVSLSMRDNTAVPRDDLTRLYVMSVQYWIKFRELTASPEPPWARLTGQELESLKWCKEGKTNWEIGEIMLISEKTVEFHLSNVMRKLGAGNRITAVIVGIKRGLITL